MKGSKIRDRKSEVRSVTREAFTLVELLVVIGIIAVLAAILMPALNAAFRKAEQAQATQELKSIETAVKAYLNEYSRFPHQPNAGDMSYGLGAGDSNLELINVLRSVAGSGNNSGTNNVRKIVFLEASENSLDATGNFIDPWGKVYTITCDTDFNNGCDLPNPVNDITNKSVAVFSAGPDTTVNTADDVKSWK